MRFESAHFKLSHEMTQLLDPLGVMKSETWDNFVSACVQLLRKLQGQEGDIVGEEASMTPNKIFQLFTQIIESLSAVPSPELALRLYLQCAEALGINNFILRSCERGAIIINPDSVADAFLASTLRYIQFQKQKGGVVGENFNSIKL
ncbi:hypothetical protein ES288_D04G126100v1 [Gossypium darwinii]|nr:hypothetical protein ES288_D04G126100v1 [Gossypium darwinii]TYG73739.1 hypothetical protein ES288_D04G126100v1 [Gossypium darwinii]TYG73740.1 hypothetical protein ES288_D04G126100v1 [Gossypium darwinii]